MTFDIKNPIVVDTETFYCDGCSVTPDKKGWVGGNWHYTHHKDFYSYMLSWYEPETGRRGVLDSTQEIQRFIAMELVDRTIIAHNAGFDIHVLQWYMPEFVPLNTFDTADMASYLQSGRSLSVAAEQLLGVKMDKALREGMKNRHYRDLTAEAKEAMKSYALNDAVTTGQLFLKYRSKWPALEQWMSNFTRCQNDAGLHIDQSYLQDQIERVSNIRSAAKGKIPWAEDHPTMSPKQVSIYCREHGILPPASLAEDSEECQAWEAQYGVQFPVVGAIRDFRKSNTYYRKLTLIERLLRPDGTIPLATKYAAAPHTLRFSATQFNYQSLPRPDMPDGKSFRYADLRGCIIPAPGSVFVGSDLAGIEARCLPWLAGDTEYLGEVAKLDAEAMVSGQSGGGDIYEPAARRMFGYSDKRPLKKTDKPLRNATKTCVLQLGYQSGASKFLWYIENNVDKETLDRVRQGNETNLQLATRLVALYRAMNPKIADYEHGLWHSLDKELRASQRAGDTFRVQQPNGRMVNYYDLMVSVTVKDGKVRNEITGLNCLGEDRTKLYGGKITENICQEMARHVLVESIYNLTQAGYRVRCSIHDENVVEVSKTANLRQAQQEIEATMSKTPAWAPGLPLAAETTIMERYAK